MLERKTATSTQVIKELEQSKTPLSVAQILELLNKSGLRPNKTTVYRILEKLILKKAITEVNVRQGASYYELSSVHHHHHFICHDCETVFCLESCHVDAHHIDLSQLLPNKDFKIQSHDFNLYGICEPCSTQA